jgi:hypothetical protein
MGLTIVNDLITLSWKADLSAAGGIIVFNLGVAFSLASVAAVYA